MSVTCTRRTALLTSLAATVLGPSAWARASGVWARGADLPAPLQEIYPTILDGAIHVAGGLLGKGASVIGVNDQHYRWRPGDGAWQVLAPLPRRLHHPNLVAFGGKLYSLGGFASRPLRVDWEMQANTLVYDPATNAWSEGPAAPEPHGETVAAALADGIHVVGGRGPLAASNTTWRDHGDTQRHLVLDPITGIWRRAAPAPTARNSAAGAVIDSRLYVVGGRQVLGSNVAVLEIYDPAADRWTTGAPMPQGQGGLAAASVGGQLFAFGGEFFDADGGVYAEAWGYNPAEDRWVALPPMPTPRHGLGAVAIGQDIYTIGGAARVGGRDTSVRVEIFTP